MITDAVLRQYPAVITAAFSMLGLGHACALVWLGIELFSRIYNGDRAIVHLGVVVALIFYFVGFAMVESRYRNWLRHK